MRMSWLFGCHRAAEDLQALTEDALEAPDRQRLLAHLRACTACRRRLEQQVRTLGMLEQLGHAPGRGVGCPEGEVLAGFADGQLPVAERRRWGLHIADCPACLAEIRELREALWDRPSGEALLREVLAEVRRADGATAPRSWSWQGALTLAAAAAVLLAVFLLRVANRPAMAPYNPAPELARSQEATPAPARKAVTPQPARSTPAPVVAAAPPAVRHRPPAETRRGRPAPRPPAPHLTRRQDRDPSPPEERLANNPLPRDFSLALAGKSEKRLEDLLANLPDALGERNPLPILDRDLYLRPNAFGKDAKRPGADRGARPEGPVRADEDATSGGGN